MGLWHLLAHAMVSDGLNAPLKCAFQLDPVERALDIFCSLDVDNNGVVTEEEFVEGCLTDPNFLAVLQTFNCDFIWNT
jgi:hypothetical protein